ncbi:MAG: CaiB/BaiF CoA transferase family protein [Sagittula sp.]|uniref:CaiB/BaiF CoA transferase family protein n=1 Tax=Sagittula sp. TaxID=2038081 RepID=UPI004059BADE
MTDDTTPGPGKPLRGIRVLDFSKVLAGPLCTQYLSDMGAEVIKIEPPEGGDETRRWPPFREPGLGAVFMAANRGKRSLALDLKSEAGQAVAHRLAATCDVAIESFGTGVAERLRIDGATLRGINPRLVTCTISGFGRSGPMRNAPGYDVILQAFAGVMSMTGEEGGKDYVRSPISPIDQTTGIHAMTGILAALYRRSVTGEGGHVEVSLFETALGLQGYNLQSFWERGEQPKRYGSSHESLCPYQAFEASDGPVLIGVANDSLWKRFCAVAGLEDIVDDPRFATNPDRVENRAETIAVVSRAVAQKPVAYWNEELAKVRVPCSPINDLATLTAHPHTAATGVVLNYETPSGQAMQAIGHPVKFDGADRAATLPPPQLGVHGDDILRGAGFEADEIAGLKAAGTIG